MIVEPLGVIRKDAGVIQPAPVLFQFAGSAPASSHQSIRGFARARRGVLSAARAATPNNLVQMQ